MRGSSRRGPARVAGTARAARAVRRTRTSQAFLRRARPWRPAGRFRARV